VQMARMGEKHARAMANLYGFPPHMMMLCGPSRSRIVEEEPKRKPVESREVEVKLLT
jgi:hypothetical protein